MDELVDEMPPEPSSESPKRNRITIKPRTSAQSASSVSPAPSGDRSQSRTPGPGDRPKMLTGKKAAAARVAEAQALTLEELDALPAAKRRKSHKARGAPGPGRGWRKGLTKWVQSHSPLNHQKNIVLMVSFFYYHRGQKPVYALPSLPAKDSTPTTFGNTAVEAKPAVPQRVVSKAEASVQPKKAAAAASAVKIHDGTADLSAKAGTAKNPGFRYPPLPSSRGGPPILPLAKIPMSFQTSVALDKSSRDKHPRRWEKAKREILSLGGRQWSVPTWYGQEDRDYERKYDPAIAAVLGQLPPGATIYGANKPPAAQRDSAGPGTPSGAHKPASVTPSGPGTVTPSKNGETGTASPLPPPRLSGTVRENVLDDSWRGQSPAFLAGGR